MTVPVCPPNWVLAQIRESLAYDEETGWVTFIKPGRKRLVGQRAGSVGKSGGRGLYRKIIIGENYKVKYLGEHNVCWFLKTGKWPISEIDHRNRDGTDNKWTNLRKATTSQQRQNSKLQSSNTTGYRGVSRDNDRNKYQAKLYINGKKIWCGRFDTPEAAAAAYKTAAAEHHDPAFRTV